MKDLDSLGLRHQSGRLEILDQTRLPDEEVWIEVPHPEVMIECIKRLAVRGAPLIGAAAAITLARFAEDGASPVAFFEIAKRLREARPTAVNLMWAVDRVAFSGNDFTVKEVVAQAEEIFDEDVAECEWMAEKGAALIQDGDGVLTHCNSGGLATCGIGTALGVIKRAHQKGKAIHVYVDETRPLLQGARLTAWELTKAGIPMTLLCDNMAAHLMSLKKVQKIFVGADRVARNGDAANKIGTYGLAIAAKYHQIPFYVVAPTSTRDNSIETGLGIPIELRKESEVQLGPNRTSFPAWNPAFDVTPRSLITDLIMPKEC